MDRQAARGRGADDRHGRSPLVRELVLLGSTGSIGTQALDVVARNPHRFRVVGLAAGGGDVDLLAKQAEATGARTVAVADPAAEASLRTALAQAGVSPTVLVGPDAAAELAALDCDVVLNG